MIDVCTRCYRSPGQGILPNLECLAGAESQDSEQKESGNVSRQKGQHKQHVRFATTECMCVTATSSGFL